MFTHYLNYIYPQPTERERDMLRSIWITKAENGYVLTVWGEDGSKEYIAAGKWELLTRVARLLGFDEPMSAARRVCCWLRRK